MYIRVQVKPGSRKETVVKTSEDEYLVSVKEKAEGNQANGRVRELLALEYLVPVSKVRIISGHHSPGKLLSVETD